jgi:hypothetical protein
MNAPSPLILTLPKGRRLNPSKLSDTQIAFDEFLDANFFGQPEARKLLRMAYANYLNPLRDKNKPIAFLVFAGESRTGKTHGARMIPQYVHGNPAALLKINCSEYMDKHSLWNLKGSPRGHISNQVTTDEKYQNVPKDQKHGYAELMNHNLEWSKKGSEAPLSIVLLDEWDKACFDFNLLMLQAMDDGQITLGSGEVVDFRNTIFIAACNSGMQEVEREEQGGIGFNQRDRKLNHKEVSNIVERVIKENTPPEFRNRLKELGGTAVFESLTPAMMKDIVRRDFKGLQDFITASGYFFTLSVTDDAVDEVLRQAMANGGNLSNVKSLITTKIQIPLGTEATKKEIKQGDTVTISVELPSGKSEVDGDPAKPVDKLFVIDVSDPIGLIGGVTAKEAPAHIDTAEAKTADASDKDGAKAQTAAASQVEKSGTNAGDGKETAEAGQSPKPMLIVQDFVIVLRASDSVFSTMKAALMKGLTEASNTTIGEETTQRGLSTGIAGMDPFNVTVLKVMAPIELMFTLKRSMPSLEINIVASPIEL